MPQSDAIERVLDRVGELPAMPGSVAEVLNITNSPDVEMSDVSKIIEKDPALAAKILKVSNSSYYGMKQFVGTIKLALVILGVREVRNIVLGISVFDTMKGADVSMQVVQGIWDNSLHIAGLSKRLTGQLQLGLQGEEFIAGLLADIGKMIMLRELEGEYLRMLKATQGNPQRLLDEELNNFGYTHADASTALAIKWSLPTPLADALWSQYPHPERPLADAAEERLAAVIRLARLANEDDFASNQAAVSTLDAETWAILDNAKCPIAPDQRRATLSSLKDEVKSAPQLVV